MASTRPRPVDDDDDDGDGLDQDRPWRELAGALGGEPLPTPDEDTLEDARLSEAELEAAAGVQAPPGRID